MKKLRSHTDSLVERLKDPARAKQYLDIALEEYQQDGDLSGFLLAVRRVIEAKDGLSATARKSKLNRGNLYSTLAKDGNPRFETIGTILHSMGFRLSVEETSSGSLK